MSNKAFIFKSEKAAPGLMAANDRVAMLLCFNLSGDCVVKPLMPFTSLKIQNKNKLPVFWRSDKKVWVQMLFL